MARLRRHGGLLATVTMVVLSAAACGLGSGENAAPQPAPDGRESTPDGSRITGAESQIESGRERGAGSQLNRSEPDAASDLERQIAQTLSDLNAESRGADTVVHIPDSVLFDFDRHELRPEAAGTLDRLAEAIIGLDAPVRVDGHTDARGEDDHNQALSERRARSVATHLVAASVQADRITAQGHGETRPLAPNTNPDGSDNPDGRAQNRRVEVTLVGVDLAELSG